MEENPKRSILVPVLAAVGLLLICAGLWLAAMSNPARFPSDVSSDRTIDLLAGSGFVCTVLGIGLLLSGVRQTTKTLPPQQRTKANVGVGVGFVVQFLGLYLINEGNERALAGLLLVFASLLLFAWGCVHFAEGKGYSRQFGALGLLGLLGLIVLLVLPAKVSDIPS